MRRVRSALEDCLGAVDARAVLFDALSEWGPDIPSTRPDFTRFVRGPLRRLLGERFGKQGAVPVLVRIENAIAVIDSINPPEEFKRRPSSMPPPATDALTTRALRPVSGGAVGVIILSENRAFATTLELALGRETVAATGASSLDSFRAGLATQPEIVIIDGTAPPTIEPLSLARTLDHLPWEPLRTIWGTDHAFGRDLAHALDSAGVHCVPFVTTEGIAPFVDLVRSRRG